MGKGGVTTVPEAVHKIQLALLDGINDENQLFAAGSLICRNDYNDVVTERTISGLCGYPLCPNELPPEPPKKGNYRLSLKEHKVYDLKETYLYCGSKCMISSKAFAGSLLEERCVILNAAKVHAVLRLFDSVGLSSDDDEDEDEESVAKAKLVIKDKDGVKGGDVRAEEWMGVSNAIEGYVPQRDRKSKSSEKGEELMISACSCHDKNVFQNEVDFDVAVKPNEKITGKKVLNKDKSTQRNHSESLEPLLSEINFTSTIITNDEYAVTKEKPNGGSKPVPSGARKAKFSAPKRHGSKKGKDSVFGNMDFTSTIITEDEYSVSKRLPSQPISDQDQVAQELSAKLNLADSEKQFKCPDNPVDLEKKFCQRSTKSAVDGSACAENEKGKLAKAPFRHSENDASSSSGYVKDDSLTAHEIHSSKAKSKSSLRTSGSKRAARSVTWADEKPNGVASGNLSEFKEIKDTKEPISLRSKVEEDNQESRRFASAEACAAALSQAAETVASGQSDATDAVFEAGITVLPEHEIDGTEECSVEDGALEERETVKWPEKLDNPDSDAIDSDNSFFDAAPEGFSLTLSPFAMMWNALFSWLTSSSLAYIYGRDDNFHEEYMSFNGREYPSKVVLPDGCSSEIKKTLAGCLSRALPGLIAELKLPTPLSTLEHGLTCLLDTMSFMDPLPPFRMKQWQVIVLLFIDALSVCRIPGLSPHLTSRRILIPKVLSAAQFSTEEYEIMKDMLIPLGRVPQFAMQSGG
ncbi:putative RNA polymerase II subunit B1 CTD phosphatase RPAP2 homolog [Silene latifolia]|uniref:putative RNA polymerase II subunit B1 CTD phosphatase RPAP2 homolog n=1 Tax=Silene latifolia TaxID=37657 RepID=UPI003D77ACF3